MCMPLRKPLKIRSRGKSPASVAPDFVTRVGKEWTAPDRKLPALSSQPAKGESQPWPVQSQPDKVQSQRRLVQSRPDQGGNKPWPV